MPSEVLLFFQSMQTREDHVVCVKHPDGTTVVEHADGTRITSFWRQITLPGLNSEETGRLQHTHTQNITINKWEQEYSICVQSLFLLR